MSKRKHITHHVPKARLGVKERKMIVHDSFVRLGGAAVGAYRSIKEKRVPESLDMRMKKSIDRARSQRVAGIFRENPELKKSFETVYGNARYWHGTGRYRKLADGSREDVLKSILQGGLRANIDPADPFGVTAAASVSPARMLSRVYAETNYVRGKKLPNAYGSWAFWGGLFTGASVTDLLRDGESRRAMLRPEHIQTVLAWNQQRTSSRDNSTFTFGLGSTIEGNYPILFGIKDDVYDIARTSAYTARSERRILGGVPVIALTHIEVPLENIDETQSLLSQFGLDNLPVLPLEYGEEYVSQFPFTALANGERLATQAITIERLITNLS